MATSQGFVKVVVAAEEADSRIRTLSRSMIDSNVLTAKLAQAKKNVVDARETVRIWAGLDKKHSDKSTQYQLGNAREQLAEMIGVRRQALSVMKSSIRRTKELFDKAQVAFCDFAGQAGVNVFPDDGN